MTRLEIATAACFVLGAGLLFPFDNTFTILTGVLLTLGRLSADSEITAMRASGISIARVARPVFVVGIVCTAAALYVNLESAPWARTQFYRELAEAVRAGGAILNPARQMDWGGYCGHMADPDGHIWEIAWNPGFPILEDGSLQLPQRRPFTS